MSLLQSTSYQVNLAINVITQDDSGLYFSIVPLVSLGWLIMAIWQCRLMVNRFRFELSVMRDEITSRLSLIGKVLGIGVSSVVWGMGL